VGAPFARPSRLPIARLVAALNRAGAPTRRSIDAGTYLCNAVLFEALDRARPDALVGFIHLPSVIHLPPVRTARRRAAPASTHRRPELLGRAVATVLPFLLADLRRRAVRPTRS
jgi:pyroglutamyl-peptidase